MIVPYRSSVTPSSLQVMTYFMSPALRTAAFGCRPVLCGLTVRPEESVNPTSAGGGAASGTHPAEDHPAWVTATAQQAGAHCSPGAPLQGRVSLPMSCQAEATNLQAAAAGKVQEAAPEGHLAVQWLDVQTCQRGCFLLLTKKLSERNNGKGDPT